jgi:pimeloyl-ACP methyl ester carboxylesterase
VSKEPPRAPFDTFRILARFQDLGQAPNTGREADYEDGNHQILGDDKLIIIGHSFGSFLVSLYASSHRRKGTRTTEKGRWEEEIK